MTDSETVVGMRVTIVGQRSASHGNAALAAALEARHGIGLPLGS